MDDVQGKSKLNVGSMLLSGLGGLSSIAQSFIDRKTAEMNQNRQNKLNMELAKYSFDQQRQIQTEQNLYNSPASQMERYKQAGLNPHLIYGQGSSGNTAVSTPRFDAPQLTYNRPAYVNPVDAINQMMDYKIRQQQLDNLKADRRSKELDQYYAGIRNFYASETISNKNRGQFLSNALKEIDRSIITNVYNEGNMPSQAYQNFVRNKWLIPSMQLSNYNTSIALNNARKDLTQKEIDWFTPRWMNSAIGAGSNLLSRLIPWKGVTRVIKK